MKAACSIVLFLSILTLPALPLGARRATNPEALKRLAEAAADRWEAGRTQLYYDLLASTDPAQVTLNRDPSIQLMYISRTGMPVYYAVDNLNAARTISTDKVWPGGGAGLSLTGAGTPATRLGIWDSGGVLLAHQEFGGRVTQIDSPSGTSDHATHVAGTMVAAGVDPNAKGMSYQANLSAYDFNNDESEMATAAAGGLMVSNHSYGFVAGWRLSGDWYWYGDVSVSTVEDYGFGFYGSDAQQLDQIAYNAPNYLIVKSAGNDRDDNGPAPGGGHYYWSGTGWTWSTATRDPDGGADGYDCIGWGKNAKNILTIGAVNDIPGGYTQPSDVVQAGFSSWGPSDDGRIKPDIVANGTGLWSCTDAGTAAYAGFGGTSMSTPNVSGSINLLVGHYISTKATNPLSSTMKALVLHTADEAGPSDGPDYQNGWGLMNTKKAALAISGAANMTEATLVNGNTHTYLCTLDVAADLRVTAAWTDPAGTPPPPFLNPTTPMLVNDLDVRAEHLLSSTVYQPWVLDGSNPANPATTGDNSVDNVEQVYIAGAPAGEYEITVSHKGALSSGQQDYSIIWDLTPAPDAQVVMPPSGYTDSDLLVTIGGASFGPYATADFGAGVTVTNVTAESPESLRVSISIDQAAAIGPRDVIVTNGGSLADTIPAGFSVLASTIHYVSTTGGNVYPYITPAGAALSLVDAIGAASDGDSVFVATTTMTNVSLNLSKAIWLYGAWNSAFTVRDLVAGKTVLDLNGNVLVSSVPAGMGIDGFVLQNGSGTSSTLPFTAYFGGALRILNSTATVANCEVASNSAAPPTYYGVGGGIFAYSSNVTIRDNEITGNDATRGGGVFLMETSGSITDNLITGNVISASTETPRGGGVMLLDCPDVAVSGNTISSNTGAQNGGGIYVENSGPVSVSGGAVSYNSASFGGAGVGTTRSTLTLNGVEISHNTSSLIGGGVNSDTSTVMLKECEVSWNGALIGGGLYSQVGEAWVEHNLFIGNNGSSGYGAVYVASMTDGRVMGNTLDRNTSAGNAGIAITSSGLEVFNNIVVNSTGKGISCSGSPAPVLTYNLVWNNSGGDYDGCSGGVGSISGDPLFADTSAVDYRLLLHSPAIDAGRPDSIYADPDSSRGDMGRYGSHSFVMLQPSYPKNLEAERVSGDVVLKWNKNPEGDVTNYAVYCDTVSGFAPSLSNFLTLVAAPDTTVNLGPPGAGQPYYRVSAVDTSGYGSGYSDEASPSTATGTGDDVISYRFGLRQNVPNPFNPVTRISYELETRSEVTLVVYDVAGRLVRRVVHQTQGPGRFTVEWDGRNARGGPVPSGVYFYKLTAGHRAQTKKMVLLR